ncbi:cytochrome b-245 chaperone 1 homolog [Chanos chanos]|uniref:Essential for reactive oxygen species protein n=1 Tax=Chanos chanos TaxID=29144 RepID=A0A6J2VE51_CHACN|nr:cytochrome b-245 chaperone 1 homolog [Chanos chanos]
MQVTGMVYMEVENHTTDKLHLKRSPGIRSWSLFVGIASVGLAAAYYSSDRAFWKAFYVTGCVFIALQNMEEWEEALFDKVKGLIELKTFSIYSWCLTLGKRGQEKMVLDLHQLRDVSVHEERVRYLGKGYIVMLRLATGFSHPLTVNATVGGRSDVEAVANLLKRFLELDKIQKGWDQNYEEDYVSDYEDDDDDDDDNNEGEEKTEPAEELRNDSQDEDTPATPQ